MKKNLLYLFIIFAFSFCFNIVANAYDFTDFELRKSDTLDFYNNNNLVYSNTCDGDDVWCWINHSPNVTANNLVNTIYYNVPLPVNTDEKTTLTLVTTLKSDTDITISKIEIFDGNKWVEQKIEDYNISNFDSDGLREIKIDFISTKEYLFGTRVYFNSTWKNTTSSNKSYTFSPLIQLSPLRKNFYGNIIYEFDNGTNLNEEFIYNVFDSIYSGFSLSEFPYISCEYRYSNSKYIQCYARDSRFYNNLIYYNHYSNYGYYNFKNNETYSSYVVFNYDIENSEFTYSYEIDKLYPYYEGTVSTYFLYYSNNNYKTFTNFNPSILDGVSSDYDSKINIFNFEEYIDTLVFDENLFANDENFKKVCVDSDFSITKKPTDGVMSESDHDYIWFPYGMSGIKQFNYSTDMSDGYYEFDDPYNNYYFSSYENINAFWNTEYVAENFESKGYTDKYKYYGYTAYLFLHWYNFNDENSYNFFPIFVLENPTITHISSSGNIHGGGGTRLDGDEEIEISDEYCFYIKNEYEVNEVILDEWGDHYVTVNTPNGPINYGTTINKDKTDSESFLSQPIKFISEMSGTITFLNANIYNLYMSMPLVVRTFLITALIIFIVMLIMKLGGYQ